jgi:hypothetical protein
MRAHAVVACLVGVALVITGCGVATNPGTIAVKTIEDDWEGFYVSSRSPFPSRPDLAGHDTIRSIHCGTKTNAAGLLRCTLVVGSSARGGTAKTVRVIVRFDAQGVLRQWKFAG